jgi:hypothetical protein
MKMAKASEKDIDAAGDAMSVLQDITSGYYPKRNGDECDDFHFDPEDQAHLSTFYRLMTRTLDAAPGWPGRVIGGMCYVILYDANKIVDPDADTLELHPRYAAMEQALRDLIARYEHDGIPNDSLPIVDAARAALGVTGPDESRRDRIGQACAEVFGWRKCEFCGCNTNAKARACCEKGRAAAGVAPCPNASMAGGCPCGYADCTKRPRGVQGGACQSCGRFWPVHLPECPRGVRASDDQPNGPQSPLEQKEGPA